MADEFLQGFQIGANAMGNRLDRQARMQELRSQDALRKIQERQINQQMQLLMQQNDLAIQSRADATKAVERAQWESSPILMWPNPLGGPPIPVPNPSPKSPSKAMVDNLVPVAAKYGGPAAAIDVLKDASMMRMQEMHALAYGAQAQGNKPLSTFGRLQADLRNAQTPEEKAQLRQKIGSELDASELPESQRASEAARLGLEATGLDPKGRVTYGRPREGENFEIIQKPGETIIRRTSGKGKDASEITASTQTTAQRNLADTQKTIVALEDVERSLRPQDVGVKGVIGEEIFDIWLPQFGVPSSDSARMNNRTKLKALIEGALREVSVDNRFSNADREAIKRVLPKAGMRESFENAIETARALKTIFAKRALIDAQTIKQTAPLWSINALSKQSLTESVEAGLIDDDALVQAFNLGKITEEEAIQLRRRRPVTNGQPNR